MDFERELSHDGLDMSLVGETAAKLMEQLPDELDGMTAATITDVAVIAAVRYVDEEGGVCSGIRLRASADAPHHQLGLLMAATRCFDG
jgi:hypothetical protein